MKGPDKSLYVSRIFITFLVGCFLCVTAAADEQPVRQLQNQLSNHASPYLAMHGNDPVQWQEWGPEVLEKARQSKKLVFISSGYFSCHWCHVMHRESYSDSEISALLNSYFIPVKIDRELRPALDDYLIDFVQKTTGQAGWPLNVFLTPEGYPLLGLTYAPPETFNQLLVRISTTWKQQSEKATRLARELVQHELQQQPQAGSVTQQQQKNFPHQAVKQALEIADEFEGGFGNQNRFPMTPQLLMMIDYLRNNDHPKLRDFLTVTLDQMKNLGLRDHVNGGFFRYTVDPGWTEPHFEKMLYTQALLVQVYLVAAEVLQRPDYLEVARDTLDFVLRDMRADKGGYVSSFSAVDAKGHEGSGYLWQQQELKRLLSEDEFEAVSRFWNISPQNHFEMGNLPLQYLSVQELAGQLKLPESEIVSRINSARKKMRDMNKTSLMPVDDKVLTAWNALLLSALSQAAMQLDDKNYLDKARKLRDFLVSYAWDGARLSRARDQGRSIGRAGLEDYAYLTTAISDFAVLTGSSEDLNLAVLFAAKAWLLFYQESGWKTGDENLLPGMTGQAALSDGALPAADAWLLLASLQADNAAIRQKAQAAALLMLPAVMELPFSHVSHNAWIRLYASRFQPGED